MTATTRQMYYGKTYPVLYQGDRVTYWALSTVTDRYERTDGIIAETNLDKPFRAYDCVRVVPAANPNVDGFWTEPANVTLAD